MSEEAREALYVAIELSSKVWKLAMATCPTQRPRLVDVPACSPALLADAVEAARSKFALPEDAAVVVCHEAGRDGFSVHRAVEKLGYVSIIVDAASIESNRRKRQAKTDRLDVRKLLRKLVQYVHGDREVWSEVRAPTAEVEDERRLHRERGRLVKSQTRLVNTIKSVLATLGLPLKLDGSLVDNLERHTTLWGDAVPRHARQEIERAVQRLELIRTQLKEIEAEMKAGLAQPQSPRQQVSRELFQLKGVGRISSWTLAHEFLWKDFSNRRQVGSAAGLTGTPYDSGESTWEQGIDKAGNRRIRGVMVELAWSWLRYQPNSKLTRWFEDRFATGGRRQRRKGIVAVARKLLIALWKYTRWGIVPEGAVGNDGELLEEVRLAA